MDMDVLFTGGTVVDGTGAAPRPADVGIRDGLIEYLGPGRPELVAAETVDCSGMVVAPGFIDIHTHSDLTVLAAPSADSAVLQGVTTQVTGNCGFSPFPVHPDRRDLLSDHVGGIGGETVPVDWSDLDGYAERLGQSPPSINVVALVGHGALRIAAMADPYAAADDADVRGMCALLAAALEQGAAGLSTGLTYPPSALADPAEIQALAAECAARGRLYATHARGMAGNEQGAIDEAIEVSRATGVRLEYSHLALNNPVNWGRAADPLRRFESAAEQGLPVGFDVYPYDASSSSALQYLPDWVQRGGSAELARRAADPDWRSAAERAIAEGFFGGIPWYWERIVLSAAPGMDDMVGLSVGQIAEQWDRPPEGVLLDICVRLGSAAQVVLHYRTEQDMRAFLAHPLSVVGSDGLARPLAGQDHPHPRSFGAFPRVVGRYVRDVPLLDLPGAVRKMTSEPARRLGLARRGVLQQGFVADLVVFDAGRVADRASFAEPRRIPQGIHRTVVSGTTVAVDGRVTPARPGRLVRCGQ
ncbi:MAG TPA: D-aminoacylase [Nakamurella sp.]|nr:D-aminoacylase [Nakamurella sp.]